MKHYPLSLRKIIFLLGWGLLFAGLLTGLIAGAARAQAPTPEAPEEPRSSVQVLGATGIDAVTPPTNSAGIATANPNAAHAVYAWPIVFNQMGHLMESYQNYGSDATGAYFHHGIDVITNNYGVNVYAVSGGQVVNIQNYNSGSMYWEVAILDAQGYVWQFHHIDYTTIPQAIKDAYSAWQANHATGGFISAGTLIGRNVQWTVSSFGYYFHHIHLNILAAGDVYINPLEFFSPSYDTQAPEIQQIGLLKDNTMVAGNTVSGSYGLYVRARDLYLSSVYYLPPYKYEFSLDGGPWTTAWEFHTFPGGANDYTYVNDFYVYPPTCGNYSCRDFIIDLGFTASGQRVFPTAPGPHSIIVRVADHNGNTAVKTYWWTVYSTYENTTASSIGDNGCSSSSGVSKTFNVTDSGLVTDVNLGLNITHATRGQLKVTLKAPSDASATTLINTSSDSYDNYDVLVDDASTNVINDNSNDTVASPNYEADRSAGPGVDLSLDGFNGKSAQGTWTVFVCDGTSGTTGQVNKVRLDISTQPARPNAIGNAAWLDEDSDGLQDAGEAGLPNVKVDLCADSACASLLRTTYTDASGGYLFKTGAAADLPAGAYYVRVTPPAGLIATYDEDGVGDSLSLVNLTAGLPYLTADFGYNWGAAVGPNAPSAGGGAIGDRVWVDVNNDGLLQDSEVGLAGVTVQLISAGSDGLFNTGDDLVVRTATTDYNGAYLFGGLSAGGYMVKLSNLPAGYTQTADPDQFGAACGSACDGQTTVPLALAPDDVFLNADFGYLPAAGLSGAIGDTLWLDSDRMNDVDAGELRLGGVTVALIKDLDGDGAWDAGEPLLATDVSDNSGVYGFSGLPAGNGEDYLVWVNDAQNALGELVPVYDLHEAMNQAAPQGSLVASLAISPVADLTSAGVSDVDFGFVPYRQDTIGGTTAIATTLDGLIGDTVWLDSNASGAFNPGEGLEGVAVRLYASGGTNLLASTVTDANGRYSFAGLNPSATYIVQVQTATLPYSGLTNFVDPDGGTASQSSVSLTSAASVNQAQDFGYRDASGPNTISGTVWNDLDADGTQDGSESAAFSGVMVGLFSGSGSAVATTTTNSSGGFSFANLPDGVFKVNVLQGNPVLNGFWKSVGPSAGSDQNSQLAPYSVTVSGGQANATADFGYYQKPAALGNRLWFDDNNNGLQDDNGGGVANWPVTLTIAWPGGATTTLMTTTDADGAYFFGNLLQSEKYDGLGSPEPSFTLSASLPAGYNPSPADVGGNDALDSDGIDTSGASSVVIGAAPNNLSLLVKGASNLDYDLGFSPIPTNSTVSPPQASVVDNTIQVAWQTYSEMDILGFNLYRATAPDGPRTLVYNTPALHPGKMFGDTYLYTDVDVQPGVTYTYWLEVLQKDGSSVTLEPTSAGLAPVYLNLYLPTIRR